MGVVMATEEETEFSGVSVRERFLGVVAIGGRNGVLVLVVVRWSLHLVSLGVVLLPV